MKKPFGKRLKEYRLSFDPIITQEWLADKMGVKQTLISAMEHRKDIHLSSVYKVLNVLEISHDKFIRETD